TTAYRRGRRHAALQPRRNRRRPSVLGPGPRELGPAAHGTRAARHARARRPPGPPGRSCGPVPRRLVPDAAARRAVRGGGRAQRRSGIPARPGHPATRVVGVRLPALLPLDPRDAESAAILVPARLLPRVLRHSVRVAARSLVQRPAGRGPTRALRRDGALAQLLR